MKLTIPFSPTTPTVLTVTAELSHVCPVVKERDHGTVTITYKPASALLELHALAALLRDYAAVIVTHEALTAELAAALRSALKPEFFSITTAWTTAGLKYEVTA